MATDKSTDSAPSTATPDRVRAFSDLASSMLLSEAERLQGPALAMGVTIAPGRLRLIEEAFALAARALLDSGVVRVVPERRRRPHPSAKMMAGTLIRRMTKKARQTIEKQGGAAA